jgi:hypothetical protein
MEAKCPKHLTVMKYIPSGTSKRTGKPYRAFYGCVSYNCKETAPATNEVETEATSLEESKKFEEEMEAEKAERAEKADKPEVSERTYWDTRKDRELKLSAKQTAIKASFELAAAKTNKLETESVTTEEAIEEAKKVYEWLLEENA